MMDEETNRSIKDWMGIFSGIYSKVDAQRTPEQIWVAVTAHSSSIGESIRRYAFSELLKYAAHTFCWLCSFVNKCNQVKDDVFSCTETVCGMVSLKYPFKCGHCRKDYCSCDPIEMDTQIDKSAKYERLVQDRQDVLLSVEGFSITDWKRKFQDIFGHRIHLLAFENIGFHFLEEVGEVAVAVRKLSQLKNVLYDGIEGIRIEFLKELTTVEGIVENYKTYYVSGDTDYTSRDTNMIKWRMVDAKMALVIEIADTFSWFCAILNKLDSILKGCGFPFSTLEEKLCEVYIDDKGNARCPTCKKEQCECIFYMKPHEVSTEVQ